MILVFSVSERSAYSAQSLHNGLSMEKTIIRRQILTTPNDFLDSTLHPTLQNIYATRGIRSMNDLERGLEHLLPYHELMGIEAGTACLLSALREQQRILIVGDFDADGATSTALAVSALAAMGAQQVDFLVPNRFKYGYGLTPEIVQVAAARQPHLIITVDNGISSCEGVAAAKSLGIKVLITDHHLAGPQLPDADAIINPNQPGDAFRSKNLAGVGVIFYVMLALRATLREQGWFIQQKITEPNMTQFLDLVALGTVADVVPLDKNNRILVHQGLQRIQAGKCRLGLLALLAVSQRQADRITSADLGFAVAPRLNAAGRLDDMSLGIACLLSNNQSAALAMAEQLNTLNLERRDIENTMQEQALAAIAQLQLDSKNQLPLGLCLFEPNWHQGVIGIIAGRIKELFHRPVIAFASVSPLEIKGSARSIPNVHIRDVLESIATKHPHLMSKFGGHAMAAGLTLELQHYPAFCHAFDQEVCKHISADDIQGKIYSDGELMPDDLHIQFAQILRSAGPWGQHFPEPLFDGHFKLLEQRIVAGKHLKLRLEHKMSNHYIDAIAFGVDLTRWPNEQIKEIKAAYKLDINEYRGSQSVQLLIEHLEPA